MTSVRAVREGIAAQLQSTGIRAYDTWPANVVPPAALVKPVSGQYHQDFDGSATWLFEVTLLLQVSTLEISQEEMDRYISTDDDRSIAAAIEANPNLGGTASSVMVTGWRDYGVLSIGDEPYRVDFMGCRFDVEVYA